MVGSENLLGLLFVELNGGIRFPREKGKVLFAWGQTTAPWAEAKSILFTQVFMAQA